MDKNTTYYETLIVRYLAGEAGTEEIYELRTWLGEGAGNLDIFKKFRKSWGLQEAQRIEKETDLDKAWDSLTERIGINEAPVALEIKTRYSKSFLQIAAVFLVLIVPSLVYYWFFLPAGEDSLIAENQVVESSLPDGTKVALNSGSVLHYPSRFKGNERKVTLEGEAFFDVARNEEKAFIIVAEDMQIKVLGTSFYVNTHASEQTMEVVLLTGSLKLDFNNKTMVLEPGDKAVVLKQHGEIVKQKNDDPNLLAWKTRELRFNNTPISVIIDVLKKVYHRDIVVLNPDINNCRITATFEGQSLEAVLLVLQSTIDIRVRPSGNMIELSGTGCQ